MTALRPETQRGTPRALRADALKAAQDAGAIGIQLSARRNVRTADIEARKLFIEAEITVEASGRPRVAS